MDLSALIFVALAVAWAVYLVPLAVRHHDEAARARSVERFSATMRVLARREAVSSRESRLVVSPGRPPSTTTVTTKETVETVERVTTVPPAPPAATAVPSAVPPAARRRAAARAAARRRRVLLVLLLAAAVVVTLAATAVVGWAWTAVPAAVLVAWLTACRLMVRRERGLVADAQLRRAQRRDARAERRDARREVRIAKRREREEDFFGDYEPPAPLAPAQDEDPTDQIAAVVASASTQVRSAVESGVWDPVPVTLPTYVAKAPAAQRTVRTIDLDSTGVWTSGPSESDSVLAREARAVEEAERTATRDAEERRATGS